MSQLQRKRLAALLALGAAIVATVTAWAYWTTTGSGRVASLAIMTPHAKPRGSDSGSATHPDRSSGATARDHRRGRGSFGRRATAASGPAAVARRPIVTGRQADASAPTFGSPALSFSTSGGAAYYPGVGRTVYYNGTTGAGSGSSIEVSAPHVADAGSGVARVAFPALGAFSGGGNDAASPYRARYTWTTANESGRQRVSAVNGAGGTRSIFFRLVRDVSAPRGGELSVAGASANGQTVADTSGSYPIASLRRYAERRSARASGLAASALVRDEASLLVDGGCGVDWDGATAIAGKRIESAGTGISGGHCYRYTLRGVDRVGNTSSIVIIVKVDTTAPAFGSPALGFTTSGDAAYYPGSGTAVYYNGSEGAGTGSSITVSSPSVADGESGIAKVSFPSPIGFTGGGGQLIPPFSATYTWTTSTASGPQMVAATNELGGTSAAGFTLVRDVAAPAGGALTVAGASTNHATTTNHTGSYPIATLTPYVEPPGAAASGLATSSLIRTRARLAPDLTCGSAWTESTRIPSARTESAATGISTGHCYRYTLGGVDHVGNSSSTEVTVKVATAWPTRARGRGRAAGRLRDWARSRARSDR